MTLRKDVEKDDSFFIMFYFDCGEDKVRMIYLKGFEEYPTVFDVQETLDTFMYDVLPNIPPEDYEGCGVFMKTLSSEQLVEVLELG